MRAARDGLAPVEGGQLAVGQGEEPRGAGQAVDGAADGLGRGPAALAQGVVQGHQVEQQLQPGLGRAAGVAAVGQHDQVDLGLDDLEPRVDQAIARPLGQHAAGDRGGDGALQRAVGRVGGLEQLAGLAGQVHRQVGDLGVRAPGGQGAGGAGQVEHPPLQALAAPAEGVPAPEHPAPVVDQPQGAAGALGPDGGQVGQPVEAVQGHGEAAAGAGGVERVAGLAHAQGPARQGHDARQDLAAMLDIDRPGIMRMGGQALGTRRRQQQPVRRRAEPLTLDMGLDIGAGARQDAGARARGSACIATSEAFDDHRAVQPPLSARILSA